MPAFERKSQPRSNIRCTITRGDGHLYDGNSITNGGVAPRNSVRFNTSAARRGHDDPEQVHRKKRQAPQPDQAAEIAAGGMNAAIRSV